MGWGTSNGLLQGLANGLQQGLITYQTMKGIQNEQKKMTLLEQQAENQKKNKMQDQYLGMLQHGFKPMRDQGGLIQMEEQFDVPKYEIDSDYFRKKAEANPMNAINVALKGRELAKPSFTPGEEKYEKDMAESIAEWDKTGKQGAAKNISNVEFALRKLEEGGADTGGLTGYAALAPIFGPTISEDVTTVQDAIFQAVQGSMKATLGAQFTQTEGQQLLQRSFNPKLGPKENIRRAKLILGEIKQIAQEKDAMAKHFKATGMVKGYKGKSLDELTANLTQMQFNSGGGASRGLIQDSGPKVGSEENGYVFKGGDPSDPKNWEKKK